MKIINIHKAITCDDLLLAIRNKLNRRFKEQRGVEINFTVENKNNAVVIAKPGIYEGFLFSIKIAGHELHVTRSEHYIDDVNALTVESILNEIFSDVAGGNTINLVQEG